MTVLALKRSPFAAAALFAAAVAPVLFFTTAPAAAQTPIHAYEFEGSYADAFGGPAIVPQGGTLSGGAYVFPANQGLSLSNAVPAATYSVETYFQITDTSSFRRLIEFKNRTSDAGLYNLNTSLNFFNVTSGPAGAINANTLTHLVLTRDDATSLVVGYVDGVQQFSFTDSGNLATFSAANQIAYLFVDDLSAGGEASAGSANYVRIYGSALSQAQVTTLYTNRNAPLTGAAVPEAGTGALTVTAALSLAGMTVARRRRAA
jgi:hypothetical protein